ncbi:hypothetical protein AXG93_2396s1090 [Marchantia polymorpha subsp. ruderalis]|uniref:Uncharacterized protein n=1 Tax=Marchantia polymorpha subsp. ruderalis TaxID=1480154 RepID=A0A176VCW4_MARPO|nr:hypothetical protein AXG93_2396s1090 [Marchantia polymorpha subsp. ruderalis]
MAMRWAPRWSRVDGGGKPTVSSVCPVGWGPGRNPVHHIGKSNWGMRKMKPTLPRASSTLPARKNGGGGRAGDEGRKEERRNQTAHGFARVGSSVMRSLGKSELMNVVALLNRQIGARAREERSIVQDARGEGLQSTPSRFRPLIGPF